MLNFDKLIPRTDTEIRQQQKLDRIRQCENLRKERFFNAKNRLIGKDNEALQKQIEEKKMIKKLEDEREKAYLSKQEVDVQAGESLQQRVDDMRKQRAKDVDLFRMTEQQKHQSREFDLNDPKMISNQMPMRLPGITDPRETTMGSFLTFNSEDYDGNKSKLMKKHLWNCLASQITENLVSKRNFSIAHLQGGKDVIEQDAVANKAIEREDKVRSQAAKSTMEYNLRKAEFEREKKKMDKFNDDEDGLAHINTCLNSDFYTENRSLMKSSLGHSKMVGTHYKGMTFEEKREIQKIQLEQIEEMKERKKAELALDNYWTEVEDLQTRVKQVRTDTDEAKRKEITKNVLEENKKLVAEQAIQRETAKRRATDNFPTDEYFDYFNTGTR